MLQSHIDHLVITAPSLEGGVEYVRQALGVSPQAGGQHPRMGTHNCVLKLGEQLYLEVISVNPNAAKPERPRWFQLDEPDQLHATRLATWVVRTNDIQAAVAASPVFLGEIEPMSRDRMSWLITVSVDGSLPLQGIAPTLIQWPAGVHPTATMRASGCSLVRLEAYHPEAEKISSLLQSIGFEGAFSIGPLAPGQTPRLVAHIETPTGLRQLSTA